MPTEEILYVLLGMIYVSKALSEYLMESAAEAA